MQSTVACFCVATWVFASCQIQSKLQTQICFQFPLCGLKQTFLPFKSVCLFHVEPLYFLYLQMFNSTQTDCKRCEKHITDFALWSFSLLTTTVLVYMVSQKLKRTHQYVMHFPNICEVGWNGTLKVKLHSPFLWQVALKNKRVVSANGKQQLSKESRLIDTSIWMGKGGPFGAMSCLTFWRLSCEHPKGTMQDRDKSGTQSSTTSQKEAWDRRKVVWMWAMSQMSCRSVFGLVCRLASDASDLVKASSLCRLRVGHIDPGQFGLSTSSHGYIFLNLVCTFHSWPGLWG